MRSNGSIARVVPACVFALLGPIGCEHANRTTEPETPVPPVQFTAQALGPTEILLTWNAPGAERIAIERAVDAAFETIAEVAASAGSYVDGDLEPGRTYRHRVRACNAAGCSAPSSTTTQNTPEPERPPVVETAAAENVTTTSADLDAVVHPNGLYTHAWFEWGTSAASLNGATPTLDVGDGEAPSELEYGLQGLQPGTSYYYRAVASNAAGRAEGELQTFTTADPPVLAPEPIVLFFSMKAGTAAVPQQVRITNGGPGSFSWTAQSDRSWLVLSPMSGDAGDQLTASIDPTALEPGVYYGAISLLAPGAAGSPTTVNVTLQVTAQATAPPGLLSPAADATNVPLLATFSWTEAFAGAEYWLVVAPDSASLPTPGATTCPNCTISGSTTLTTYGPSSPFNLTTERIRSFDEDRTYYWRVRASAGPGSAAWSPIRRFTTVEPPPPAPATPSVSSVATNPSSPIEDQSFTLTVNGSDFHTSNAQIVINGPGCGPCVVNNGALSSKSATKLVASVTLAQTGSFTVAVRNGSSGIRSNTRTITVIAPPPTTPVVPSISSLSTNPSSPVEDQSFTLTVNGSDFNTSNAQIVINGPGCGPCVVNNGALSSKSATKLVASVTLAQTGSFTVAVRNGSSGTLSNTRTITVIDPPPPPPPVPTVSSVSTNPSSPVEDQTFQITVNGSAFDPSNAQIVLNGPGCGPCVLNNGSMTSKTSTRLIGPVTVSQSGSFTVAVRNGGGTLSNTRTISVAAGSSGQPTTFVNPLTSWVVLQDFGAWSDSQGGYHLAEDVRASPGTPVMAAANGTVQLAEVDVQGYGGIIIIEHIVNGEPIETLYGHLSKSRGLKVQNGQTVTKGQLIAYIADDNEDGGAWGPHLHFGIRQGPFSLAKICGYWYFMGYTLQCSGVTHAQYIAPWYDPSDFMNANR